MGPLLFLVYVNDLGNALQGSGHYLYADDTVIFKSGINVPDTVAELQNDLNGFGSWCRANKLSINTKKSNYVIYGTKQKSARIRHCLLTHSRRALFRVCDIGFGQIEDILGIILVKELFKKSN